MSPGEPDLQFGPFRLSFCPKRLVRDGAEVPLTPKAFDTLAVLARRPGEALEKQDLMRSVWGEVFVDDSTLTQNIFTVRKALGDGSYIETIPRRGYRFVAPVREIIEDENQKPPAEVSPATGGMKLSRPRTLIILAAGVFALAQGRRVIWTAVAVAVVLVAGWFAWRGGSTTQPVRSLVVLPFVNLSGDPAREYFSDGLTEEVINALAPIPGLRVVARTSSFQFKGKASDVRAIGATLGVDAVLEGSVRVDGDRLRVTAQFNDARTGFHYWSHSWDHAAKDVFAVQQQIAQEVLEALGQKRGVKIPETKPLTQSLEARDYYLQGHHFKDRILEGMLPRAVEAYESALKVDPGFAAAHAQIAQVYVWALQSGKVPSADALPIIKSHARKALDLDPGLALAHAVQADISFFADWDFISAERDFRRAIGLNPADADARHEFSHFLLAMRRFKEAEIEAERTAEMDPVSIDALTHLQLHFIMVRDTRRAISAADRALAVDPNAADPLRYLQRTYENSGQFQKAIETAAKRPDLQAGVAASLQRGFTAEAAPGYWKAWHQAALRTPMDESARAWEMATFDSRLGKNDEALQWLEKAVKLHYSNAVYLNVTPEFEALRTRPEFQHLVQAVGLPEQVANR